MQVNSINNTNFKAMKVNPVLRSEIIKKGKDFVTELNNYGKQVADVKMYDVVFVDNIDCPKIFSMDMKVSRDFFYELKQEEKFLGKCYEVPAGPVGDTRGGFYPDEPRAFQKYYGKDASAQYAEFKKLNIYEQAIRYSRILEELDIKKMVTDAKAKSEKRVNDFIQQAQEQQLNEELDNFIGKYGAEYKEPVADEIQKKSVKKHWWQKLFL